jgi:uncharacterized paraquat-inducible protein A
MDDFDLILDELGGEETEEKYWMCEECNLDDIDSEETKCPRCGHKHKHHYARPEDQEYDENGDPLDVAYYEEHY